MPSRNFGRSEFITQFRRELTLSSLPADAQQRARRATCFAAVSCLFFYFSQCLLDQLFHDLPDRSLPFFLVNFYRAMLCIRGTSHGPVSICLSVSVTSRSSTKTAKRRITRTTPHDSPGALVFWRQSSPRNSTGVTPYGGAKCRWGGSKATNFDK